MMCDYKAKSIKVLQKMLFNWHLYPNPTDYFVFLTFGRVILDYVYYVKFRTIARNFT